MKTFEEGEWLAFQYETWMVKEISKHGNKLYYNISNGAVETSVSPTDRDLFKLTLSIKNLIESMRADYKQLGEVSHGIKNGLNWPDIHAVFSHHFNKMATMLEKYERDFENPKFKTSYEKLWEEYQATLREWHAAIKAADKMQVGGISVFRS